MTALFHKTSKLSSFLIVGQGCIRVISADGKAELLKKIIWKLK